ncbi:hypothetical protein DFS34DRAFT_654747 [Phlyctochytrium arcticum]|nr:hypothetical protein DFS34DRAFT_654747 [Phlyctochytrium arcticum]
MMHIALNAQLALLRWAFTVIMPLWHAAFPNAVIDPVKIHSIRRVMILTLMLLAWKGARELVFKMHAALKDKWTDVQRVFIESLIRLFDEDMPLVLDASAALATGNVKLYKEVLICLLPMFIRLNKKNYVIIILFILTTMDQFEKSPADAKAAMKSFLAVASSEDLEVFNSLLRDAIRPYGSENAAVIKTLYVSVTQERSARAFLAEVACLKKEKEQDPTAQYTHSFNLNEASPLQLKDNQPQRNAEVGAAIITMFERLMGPTSRVSVQAAFDETAPVYKVFLKSPPPILVAEGSSTAKKSKKVSQKAALWKVPVLKLNTHIAITDYKAHSIPSGREPPAKKPLTNVTNTTTHKTSAKKPAAPKQEYFLSLNTLLQKHLTCNLTMPAEDADLAMRDDDENVTTADFMEDF